jgi:hypothetical protein
VLEGRKPWEGDGDGEGLGLGMRRRFSRQELGHGNRLSRVAIVCLPELNHHKVTKTMTPTTCSMPQPSTRRQIRSDRAERTVQIRTQAEAWAVVRAEALEQMLAQTQKQEQERARIMGPQVLGPALAQSGPLAAVQREVQVRMRGLVQARVQAQAQARSQVQAQVQARALARAQTQAQADALAQVWSQVWAQVREAQARVQVRAEAHSVTYREVLVDPKLMGIIYSIEPDYRQRLARDLRPTCHSWFIQIIVPITRLPPELLHQIFLIIIDNANDSPLALMQVCKYWYDIVTGIWASLKLGTTTPIDDITRKLNRNQWLLDVVVDTEIDRRSFALPVASDSLFDITPSPSSDTGQSLFVPLNRNFGIYSTPPYQAIFAAMQATSRWRTLVVETFPAQADLPEDLVNRGLQQCDDSVMSRLSTLIIKCPCEMSPLLDRLLHILGNTASRELTTVTINSSIVISFLVPTYSSIFRSVTVLSLDAPGLPNPVDLLPHLHQLETLTASHLPLPNYHDDVDLPFVHTLRHLTLRSVSVQWMSSRTFHVLENCTITFPIHCRILHTFRSTLPNCQYLSFEGYPLDILNGVSAPKLTHLSVKCSSSYKPRGNRQLACFSSQALQEGRLVPRVLHISIEAMNEAWSKALASMSDLEELVIENAQPSSLGVKALRSLIVLPGATGTPVEWNTPAFPSLKRFGLRYRRWLRPSEHFDLIPVFMSIIRSRHQSKRSLQSFCIWGSNDQEAPLELVDGSQIELTIELTTYQSRAGAPTQISGFPVVQLRRDVVVWLTLDIRSLPTHNAKPWSALRIFRTPSANAHREDRVGANILSIDVLVFGATKHREYTEACRNCKESRGAGPIIDFRGKVDIIEVTKGIARVNFAFCCCPADRDEEEYYQCVTSPVLVPILLLTSLEQCRGRLIRMAH